MTDLTGRADLSRCLMRYFIKASNCNSDLYTNKLDIDIIVDLLHRGADLNWRDTHGQTVLHEVALNWSPEVAEQMVRSGANVRAADDFGWTPLHVAAAYDYPEMCRTLVQLGADKEARANNGQTPLFFAAKTDSTRALRALIKLGCEMEERDERQRTPLFAACELVRCQFTKAASDGALQSLGANKSRTAGRVRGAGVSQQTVDVAPSPRLSPPHLLHRLRTVGLGADDVACQLESPTAQQIARTGQAGAMIERRVGDSLVADLEGGAQQASVRRVDLSLERVCQRPGLGVPSKSSATPQILADVGNQTAEVDELLTSWKLTRLSVSASAEDCSLGVHDGLLRVDHQADARRNGNQPIQLSLGALDGRGQQGEVIGVAKHAEPSLRLASTHASPQQEAVVVGRQSSPINRNGASVSPWSTPEDVSKKSDRPSGVETAAVVPWYSAMTAEISSSGTLYARSTSGSASLTTESKAFLKSTKIRIRVNWRMRASSMTRRRARICVTVPRWGRNPFCSGRRYGSSTGCNRDSSMRLNSFAAQDCRQMPRCSSSLVVPGFFGMATMCAVVHSFGATSPKSTRFITLATSVATQWIRSASVGTSSGPSALPPGDCRANFTTSAVLTGATLKLSSAGNGVSGGSLRFSGSGGGGALTMAAKNSRSSFLRSSGVSPARRKAGRESPTAQSNSNRAADRSETAALLLEHNCDAFVQDKTGQIAFVPLIKKMPPLTYRALNLQSQCKAETALAQLNKTYRIERKQKLDLFRLDPRQVESTGADEGVDTKGKQEVVRVAYHSALKAIIETNNYQMIDSTVISAMLGVQWTQFGRIRAIGQIILQLINIILWTIFAVDKEWTQRHEYDFPREGYRVAVLIGAIGITAYLIIEEIMEIVRSRRRHEAWKTWKLKLIEEDLELVHPSHDDESKYLRKEVEEIKKSQISYFDDWWNYLDWACYIILLASLISHFAEVGWPGGEGNLVLARWHVRIMALNIVVLWIRLLKYVKPFEFFGPFIVMLGMILGDLAKFFLLYLEFFIPFTCIFWTILGGDKNLREADILTSKTLKNYSMHNFTRVTVENMETFYSTAFSMFRLTLVDEYQYDQMADIDPITSQIILGCWFAISAILFLNLFIAQLSETFKSVFDNAKPAAAMQKAITLLNCYESMRMSQRVKFHKYLKEECNPLKLHYDDDVTMSSSVEEQQKATLEIRDMVKKIQKRVTRLYEKEIEQSDSDENDLVVDESEARRQQRKRKTKTRQMAEKAALRMQARLEELESSTRSELLGIHRMLQDIAIVVAGLTRDDSNVSAASGPSRPPPPASNRDFSEQQQQHDDEFEGANNEGSVTFAPDGRANLAEAEAAEA
uniref:ANK_REP_REGION domain-containing protein n=1 Tax=Macrostomum lignano TaxID=282301 RepID=A0A1I8HWT9_9PLAT